MHEQKRATGTPWAHVAIAALVMVVVLATAELGPLAPPRETWLWRSLGAAALGLFLAPFAAAAGGLLWLVLEGAGRLLSGDKSGAQLLGAGPFILGVLGWLSYMAATGPVSALMSDDAPYFGGWCVGLALAGGVGLARWRLRGGALRDDGRSLSPDGGGDWVPYARPALTLAVHTPTLLGVVQLTATPGARGAAWALIGLGVAADLALRRALGHSADREPMPIELFERPRALLIDEGWRVEAREVAAIQHASWHNAIQPHERRTTFVRVDLLLKTGGTITLLEGDSDQVVASAERAERLARGLRVPVRRGKRANDWPTQWRADPSAEPTERPPEPLQGPLSARPSATGLVIQHAPSLSSSGRADAALTPWLHGALAVAALLTTRQIAALWSWAPPLAPLWVWCAVLGSLWVIGATRSRLRRRAATRSWKINAEGIKNLGGGAPRALHRDDVRWVRLNAHLPRRSASLSVGGPKGTWTLIEIFEDHVESTMAQLAIARDHVAAELELP